MLAIDIKSTHEVLRNMKQKRLPIRLSLAIAKNYRVLDEEVSDIDNMRIDIINRYAEKDDEGNIKTDENNNAIIISGHEDDINKELTELLYSDIDINLQHVCIDDVMMCDLDKFDSLTVDEVEVLEKMIDTTGGDYNE